MKIDIDKTEDDYVHFEGNTIEELEAFIYENSVFADCCGVIDYSEESDGNEGAQLWIAALKEYGVYLGYMKGERIKLSLRDRTKLGSVLDVWGDGLYVSEGLFIPPEAAWKCIRDFAGSGEVSEDIDWISPDDLPEEGNYII